MRRALPTIGSIGAVTALLLSPARAQEPAQEPVEETIRVFLDCQTFLCDYDHFRREITFINWVRDRQDAQLHILVTALQTGGGGWELTFAFIGLEDLAGREDTLRYVSSNTDTSDEIRSGMTQTLKLGLVRYVARTPVAERISITYDVPMVETPALAVDDPWNLWSFSVRVGIDLDGESQQRFVGLNGTINANRTAEDVKINFSLFGRYSRNETDVPELDTTFVNEQERYNFNGLVVWSIGDHWAAGVRGSAGRSTFLNEDLSLRAGPAIEYNIYPYEESTRRQVTIGYSIGVAAFDYDEITVFDRTSEVRPTHSMEIGLGVAQPWGSVRTSLEASQFFHDLSAHSIGLFGSFDIRLVRGLSFGGFGSVARIKDQLYLSGAGLSPEDRLQRTRQFETDFRYFVGLNFRFRFGSKFANVVNTRMGGGGGGMIMMF